jgi:hypothetical protein
MYHRAKSVDSTQGHPTCRPGVWVFVTLLSFLVSGCSSPTSPGSSGSGGTAASFDGTWSGTWSDSEGRHQLTFCVGCRGFVGTTLEAVHHDISDFFWDIPSCTNVSPLNEGAGLGVNKPNLHIKIANNSFNTGQIGFFVPTVFAGTFSSSTSASGTVQFVFQNAPIFLPGSTGRCPNSFTANWSAVRTGSSPQ